ncbi:MAG: HD domain-containing protein [Synergistaceae bacterium]|nr:HD domain-containing protein [Synergistaceae bacterium]
MKIHESPFNIIRTVMSLINDKFIDHGIRVAYICHMMSKYEGRVDGHELRMMTSSALFHDIGAYKTEEVEDLMHFEVANSLPHAVYGYLFTKYLSPLDSQAEVILYHHMPYSDSLKHTSPYMKQALRMHLADRIDISALFDGDNRAVIDAVAKYSGSLFSPYEVELFINADKKYDIINAIRDDTCETYMRDYYNGLALKEEELIKLIKMLVFTIDFRSEQTIVHTIQVAAFAKLLGEYFNMSEEEQEDLYFAGLLHDFGKIKVPVSILEKDGPLDNDEWPVMKRHAQWTREIVGGFANDDITEIAARHHEKLNGSGYPGKLLADDLTLSQRIMAVADIASALSGKRSYKDPMPKETVLGILEKMGGNGQLDSDIIKVLEANYDAFMSKSAHDSQDAASRYEALKSEYAALISKYTSLDDKFYATNEQLFADLAASSCCA